MSGIEAIAAERQRQIDVEGWTPEHDDQHNRNQLAWAAACYAYLAGHQARDSFFGKPCGPWPFELSWWKPKDRRSDLVRAGALIAAEIDRLDRADKQST